jgi:alpha-1,3-mannosyl-glycoprotein beta-1,2-N-acetylglucosaminyltransferase
MISRGRFGIYVLFGVLFFWTCSTYLFLVNRAGTKMPTPADSAEQVRFRIRELEKDVQKQKDANQQLLRFLWDKFGVATKISDEGAPQIAIRAYVPTRTVAATSSAVGKGLQKPRGRPSAFSHSTIKYPPAVSGTQDGLSSAATLRGSQEVIAVLVFACNRPQAIRAHLDQLLRIRPSAEQFPIYVSQDCKFHEETKKAILSYGDKITYLQHPDQSEIKLPPKQKKFVGYYKISRHYRWALNHTFYVLDHRAVIITEDDLDIGPDFFEYFLATYTLLRLDPTLWCVSAWNDNGKLNMVDGGHPELLYRTDFFPGLGWMLTRETYEELEPKWPITFWDDWMRRPEQRQDRACIRPEVPRTAMSRHGKVGVSKGLYFDKHLKMIALNKKFVPFTKMDLSYLLKNNYDKAFSARVYAAPVVALGDLQRMTYESRHRTPAVRLEYDSSQSFKSITKALKLMEDFRAGVPRIAYRGVIPFMYNGIRVYLAPPPGWKAYDINWN